MSIINTIFQKVYVMNLKDSLDRKKHIENEFQRVGIKKYDFFEATPYDSKEVVDMIESNLTKKFPTCYRCNQLRCGCHTNFLTLFQIANWCSFLNIFKDILKNDYEFVLICEDDIVFTFQAEQIINELLSPHSFQKYRINMKKPLLIRLGAGYNDYNHNSIEPPRFIKDFTLGNPCFAINKYMAALYLYYLKTIYHSSDDYFHVKIPKYIRGVQYFTMFPFPIYELSYGAGPLTFESKVRPNNQIRRIEYKDILFLSSNFICISLLDDIVKKGGLDININSIGYHGNINSYVLMDEKMKQSYYFHYKILFIDNKEDDIKIISKNIRTNNIEIYKPYFAKIKELFGVEIEIKPENSEIFYKYYMKLLNQELQSSIYTRQIGLDKFSFYTKEEHFNNNFIINIHNEEDLQKLSFLNQVKLDELKEMIQSYIKSKNEYILQ